ncbi:hypothetical protein B9T30_12805 [Acinetobacter sp. ANC 4973]|nr:hypothetical protein B9T30_12805 [Acinetobacter sp. ANC 4973]
MILVESIIDKKKHELAKFFSIYDFVLILTRNWLQTVEKAISNITLKCMSHIWHKYMMYRKL